MTFVKSVSLYADDAKLYRRIITINDARILQSDLDAIFAWSQLWKLSFNINKCLHLSICRSLKVIYIYMLDHNALEPVDTINDLGVTATSNLSWSKNIKSISAKANSLQGMIRRFISFDAPSPVKFQLYVSHIRSILEYCQRPCTIRQSTLPKTWNRSQCCPPVLGVGTNAFAIYQVWFYHTTTSNYDIDHIKNNTYFTSKKQKNKYWRRFTFIFIQ